VCYRVLWIEDGAKKGEFARLLGPLTIEPAIDLRVASDATEGSEALRAPGPAYDVVILDLRLYPGHSTGWIKRFDQRGRQAAQACLGVDLIAAVLQGDKDLNIDALPWLKPEAIAVLSVESRRSQAATKVADLGVEGIYEKRDEFAPREYPLTIEIVRDRLVALGRQPRFAYYV
jgi:hypothetical protein